MTAAIDELTARRMYALAAQLWTAALRSTDHTLAERMLTKPKPGELVLTNLIKPTDWADGVGLFVREVKVYRVDHEDGDAHWVDDDPACGGPHVTTDYIIRRLTHPETDFRWSNCSILVLPDGERWRY